MPSSLQCNEEVGIVATVTLQVNRTVIMCVVMVYMQLTLEFLSKVTKIAGVMQQLLYAIETHSVSLV